jgi:hypothetical protein
MRHIIILGALIGVLVGYVLAMAIIGYDEDDCRNSYYHAKELYEAAADKLFLCQLQQQTTQEEWYNVSYRLGEVRDSDERD